MKFHIAAILVSMMMLGLSQHALAQATESSPSLVPPESSKQGEPAEEEFHAQEHLIETEGILRLDNDFIPNEEGVRTYNLRAEKFELQASLRLLQNFKVAQELLLVGRTKMERDFYKNGVYSPNKLIGSDYIKELYFALNRVGGYPVAILLGSTEISFGQDYAGTLDYQNDASHAMTDPDQGQIKGITFILERHHSAIDKLAATFFAPNPNISEASLNHFDGVSMRLSKTWIEHFETQVSFVRKGNSYDPALTEEQKYSLGAIVETEPWTFYVEAVRMLNAAAYPTAPWGYTSGIARTFGTSKGSVEYTKVKDVLDQYVLGWQFYLTKFWTAGTTYRFTQCDMDGTACGGAEGFSKGASYHASIQFNFGDENQNKNSFWGVKQ